MKLADLEPRWIHPNIFVFRCPHCKTMWLSCGNICMSYADQHRLFREVFGPKWTTQVVPLNPKAAWKITGTLPNLTAEPSIDASASGHWHGHITKGEVK